MLLNTLASTDGGNALDLLLILGAAAAVTMALRRLRLATIPGYLIAGAIIGPALGLVTDAVNIEAISGLAVILLMFTIGLHLDLSNLHGGMVAIFVVGVVATLLTTVGLWPVGMAFGLSAPEALAVAMAMAMSSTAVVVRMLQQRRELASNIGRIAFGILVIQDLIALAYLAMLKPVAKWAGAETGPATAAAEEALGPASPLAMIADAAQSLGGIAALIVLGRWLLPKLLHEASREKSGESQLVLAAAVALGAAIVTQLLGFSPELGAFLAGFLLASTPFRHQLAGQMSPMRDLFLAVFFTSVGLRISFDALADQWAAILAGLAALIVIKGFVTALCVWGAGAPGDTAVGTGLILAQGSEFSLVILAVAGSKGIITKEIETSLICLIVLSLIITPAFVTNAHRIAHRAAALRTSPFHGGALRSMAAKAKEPDAHASPEAAADLSAPQSTPLARYVIVAGFGIVGRTIVDHLIVNKVPFVLVDLNVETVRTQRRLGRSALYGDITNPEVLEAAGLHHADVIILTIPDDDAILRACRMIRLIAPGIFIAVRTNFLSKAMAAAELGADHVTVEEVATAETMQREVMRALERRRSRRDGPPSTA